MRIYFVRHAQTVLNADGRLHQYHEGRLSEYGLRQAMMLAARFKGVVVEEVLSSPYERAKITAELIMAEVQAPVVYSDLLREFGGPSEMEGKHKHDPEVIRINKLMSENRHDPHWRYSNEESYYELVTRAQKALGFLVGRDCENVLCVTHGLFLRVMLGVMIFGDSMTREELLKWMRFVSISNTGVTVCEFSGNWKLVTLNDLAHVN